MGTICCLAVTSHVSAWSMRQDCEGPLGVKVDGMFKATTYTNEQVKAGSTSCRLAVRKGTVGWGEFGAMMLFPEPLVKGQELWIRLDLFVPEGFDYTANPQLKFMRVHTQSRAGENFGYLDFLITPDGPSHWSKKLNGLTDAPFYFYYETVVNQEYPGSYEKDRIKKGQWESFEIYYYLDSVSTENNGRGRVRIWKNEELLADLPSQTTLKNAEAVANSFLLFTYWNGGSPQDQHLYIDNIVITSDRPSNVDAAGYSFIGKGSAKAESPKPMAPNNIKIGFR
jgi:hypothetical protein